jgi:alpha-beta hydrolase superfamily lysophospholipase
MLSFTDAALARATFLALSFVLSQGCGGAPNLPARPTSTLPDSTRAAHSESLFKAKDGTPLYEQSWRPSGPARAAVVVVHGLKDHGDRYAELAASLTSRGFSVHAADLRGHGRSGGERVWVDHFDDYVDDLALYVDLLKSREAPKKIIVFGHSMGGAIVALYYLEKKPDLAGLILSGAALKASVSGFKIFGTNVIAGIAPHAAVFQLDLHDFSRDPSVVEASEHDPLVYQPPATAHLAHELLGAMKPIEDGLDRFDVPMLLLHGSKDVVTDPEGTRALFEHAKGKATLRIYDGFYHDLLHEPGRAAVIADIDAFVERVAPAGG